MPNQLLEELDLGRVELPARLLDGEETSIIDFRKLLDASGARRPLEWKPVALDGKPIGPISFYGPGHNGLVIALDDGSERHRLARTTVGQGSSGLLLELSPGRLEGVFAGLVFSFWQAPRSHILVGEEGTSRMNEKNLETT